MDPVTSFLEDASKWVTDPCDIDIRYVARRGRPGGHEIVAAAISVVPFPLKNSEDFEFFLEEGDFWFGQAQMHEVPVDTANSIIRGVCNGTISARGKEMKLRASEINFRRDNLGNEWHVSHAGLSLESALIPCEIDPAVIRALNEVLRRSIPPFDGLEDLLSWLALKDDFSSQGNSRLRIHIAAPADMATDRTKVEGGKVHVTIVAHPKLNTDSLHVAVRGMPPKGIKFRVQIADKLKWGQPSDGRKFGSAIIDLPGVDAAQVMLSVGNQYIRRQWFIDPIRSKNERYLATNLFDGNLKMVRRYLFDDNNPDKFELAVASLIYMMGFNPAVQCETDASDILVMAPSGRLAIVECTVKLSDIGAKVGKLVYRRDKLARALSTDGRSVQVLSVLVCQLERAQIAIDKDELAQKGIILVAKEDLAHQIETGLHLPSDPEEKYLGMLKRLSTYKAPTSSPE
jgi:hypothetical protein